MLFDRIDYLAERGFFVFGLDVALVGDLCGFIANLGERGSAEARGFLGKQVEIDIFCRPLFYRMDLKDLRPPFSVGMGNDDFFVESAGPGCRLVEYVFAV